MATVAVVHNTLANRGGADAVCLHVCEALSAVHDVTLHTLSHPPLAELNDLFDTAADVSVAVPPVAGRLAAGIERVERVAGPQLAAQSALLARTLDGRLDRYDAVVSTANEFDFDQPSVQYIHGPQFGGSSVSNRLWSRLAGVEQLPARSRLLANSTYTARLVHDRYGRRPTVCHPPVNPIPGGRRWADREPGVLTVGRIAADNRLFTALEIVDELRARGHGLSLHLVGSTSPRAARYERDLRQAVARRPYVTLRTNVSRGELERLLGRYRYGLNVRRRESFGMAVAEYVAAGMLAFAPDEGGQRDVLAHDADRLFGSPSEAVRLLSAAIDRDDRPTLPPDRFAADRFHEAVRQQVAALV